MIMGLVLKKVLFLKYLIHFSQQKVRKAEQDWACQFLMELFRR